MGADDVAFAPEAEELRFDRVEIPLRVDCRRKDGIECRGEPFARPFAGHRQVFVSLPDPELCESAAAQVPAAVDWRTGAGDPVMVPLVRPAPRPLRKRK